MLTRVFGKQRLDEITAEDAETFKTSRCQEVKPATVNREMTVLKHITSKALEWKLVSTNPIRDVRSLKVLARLERILELDEEKRLFSACDNVGSRYLRPLVTRALNTGMRRGELLALKWTEVDLTSRKARILNAKTSAGQRTIPMNSTPYSLLSDLERRKTSDLVFSQQPESGGRNSGS
jgi:integrase